MEFEGKITCEPGRVIARDNLPLFYISIARRSQLGGYVKDPRQYAIAPWQADSLARQIAAAMRAGIIQVPAELEDGRRLDERAAALIGGSYAP